MPGISARHLLAGSAVLLLGMGCGYRAHLRTARVDIVQRQLPPRASATTAVADGVEEKRQRRGDTIEMVQLRRGDTLWTMWYDLRDTSAWAREHPYTERTVKTAIYPEYLNCTSLVMIRQDSINFLFCVDSLMAITTADYAPSQYTIEMSYEARARRYHHRAYRKVLRQLEKMKRNGDSEWKGASAFTFLERAPFNFAEGTDVLWIIKDEYGSGLGGSIQYRCIDQKGDTVPCGILLNWMR